MSHKFVQDLSNGKMDCIHSAEITHALHEQWLSGKYCDLKVLVEGCQYSVHKCVIASFSRKLDCEIDSLDTIKLVGVTKYGFEKVLEFLYLGKISQLSTIKLPKFQEIMRVGDALSAPKVIRYCAKERSDLVPLLDKNCPLDGESTASEDEIQMLANGTDSSSCEPHGALVMDCDDDIDDEAAKLNNSAEREDEDPLKDSTKSLVECLEADGEIGRGLSKALSVVDKALTKEELANLLDVPPQPMDLYAPETSSSERKQANGRKIRQSILKVGWNHKFQCSICRKGFLTDELLQQHMKRHNVNPAKQHRCGQCGMVFRFQISLLSHMKLHKLNRAVCKVCGKGFKYNSSLQMHIEKCHPEKCGRIKTYGNTKNESITKNSNKQVARVTKTPELPRVDITQLMGILNEMQPEQSGKYICPICDKDFSRKWNLKYHVLRHSEDRVQWPKFDPKSGQMLHQCNECESSFQKETGLRRHMAIMHRDNYLSTTKPLAMLGRKRKPNMKYKDGAPIEITFWCDICGKGFKRKRNLKGHMETHNGSGFQCPICGRMFSQKDGLHGHLWVHGGYSGNKAEETTRGSRRRMQQGSVVQDPIASNPNLLPIQGGEVVVLQGEAEEVKESSEVPCKESEMSPKCDVAQADTVQPESCH